MNRLIAPGLIALAAVPALLALGAAAVVAAPHDGLVRLGQTFRADRTSIRPIRVLEDSRCPANARCIWAGRVVVRADVGTGRRHQRMDLTLGEPQALANGSVALTTVEPARYTNSKLRLGDYRLGFEVTHNPSR